jgi:hypothetical protein
MNDVVMDARHCLLCFDRPCVVLRVEVKGDFNVVFESGSGDR